MENNIDEQFVASHTVEKNRKYPGPLAAGILFSITTIFLTYGSILLPFENDFLRSGLGEVLFILLPVLIFLLLRKYNIKDTLKLKKTKPINYLIVPLLMITALPIVAVFNAIALGLIRLIFGKNLPVEQISIPDVPTLFIAILVVGVSAAVCEETLFRGLISKSYERYGIVASLVITSILFGILHRDIQKCVSTILLGALIGFIVYRTKSIYAGMVAHFTNNTIAVLLLFSASSALEQMEELGINQAGGLDFSNLPMISWVIIILFYLMMFLGCVGVFIALIYAFCRVNKNDIKAIKNTFILEEANAVKDRFMTAAAEEIKDGTASVDSIEAQNEKISENRADQDWLKPDDYNVDQVRIESAQVNDMVSQNDEILIIENSKSRKFSLAGFIAVLPGLILIILTFIGQLLKLLNVDRGVLYNVLKTLWLIWPD